MLAVILPQLAWAAASPAQLLSQRSRWRPQMEFEVGRLLLRNDVPAKRAEGLARLETAARAGHSIAAVYVGYAREAGLTEKPSLDAALVWYRQAARVENRVGAIALEASLSSRDEAKLVSKLRYSSRRITAAEYADYFEWIRKKSDEGSPRHQYMLARLLEVSAVTPSRGDAYRETRRLYRRAAASGHPEAAFQLWDDYKEHCNDGLLDGIVRSIKELRYERKARRTGSQLFKLYWGLPDR